VSKRRSDALQALVAELADARDLVGDYSHEREEAQREFVAARQVLDTANERLKAAEGRVADTDEAIRIIQRRDDIGDDVVAALVERAAR
jgi:chromosome segregation ATPase